MIISGILSNNTVRTAFKKFPFLGTADVVTQVTAIGSICVAKVKQSIRDFLGHNNEGIIFYKDAT